MSRHHWLVVCMSLSLASVARAEDGVLTVSDLKTDVPAIYNNAVIGLRLAAIRPVDAAKGDVVVALRWNGGAWATNGNMAAADYNEVGANSVEVEGGRFDGRTLTASLLIRIGPDGAARGRSKFPTPPDVFRVKVAAELRKGELVPWEPDREAFMPPWRKDVPSFGGELVVGTYSGEWVWKNVTNTVEGVVRGGVNHEPVPGWWGIRGNGGLGIATGGGLDILARLPARPVADRGEAWACRMFSVPANWSGYDGIRLTVESDVRRDEVMLAVQVADSAGRRARVLDAAPMGVGRVTAVVPFVDFGSGIGSLDWSRVMRVDIGFSNRRGVGDVRCTVRAIELVKTGTAPVVRAEVTVEVKPNLAAIINGVGDIPKGLFGIHDVGAIEKPVKALPDQPDAGVYLQQLRPGMFRKVEHTGFGGKPISDEDARKRVADRPAREEPDTAAYKRLKIGDAVDNVIVCHTMDLWARPRWLDHGLDGLSNDVKVAYRNIAAGAWVPGDNFNTARKFEVWNEPFMWGRHINMGFRVPPGSKDVTDETQYGFLPGRVGADAWSTVFLAAWEGAKKVNPNIQLGGPSAPAFEDDEYRMFRNYLARILDRVGDKIDFLTEHHYGGDPRTVVAGYEVATAWCDIRYGRRIPIYNTEANDLGASEAGKAAFNMLDILTCATVCPDKARGRALHALWNGYLKDRGEEHAYMLMRPLRGRRVVATSTHPDVVCAASCPEVGSMVVVILNAGETEKTVRLSPVSLGVREGMILLGTRPAKELELRDVDGAFLPTPESGKTVMSALAVNGMAKGDPIIMNLPPGCAVRWTFVQQNYEPKEEVRTDQHFSTALLADVVPDSPVDATVTFRGPSDGGKRAWVRLIAGGVQTGEGVMEIGGKSIPLPSDRRRDGRILHVDIPIDPALVKADMKMTFRCVDPAKANGFTVYAASVLVER